MSRLTINYCPVTGDEEIVLIRAAQAGDRSAVQRLVESQAAAVRKLARRYATATCPAEDLEQEGHLALLEAIATYRPEGFRLWSAVRRAVAGAMADAVAQAATPVTLPSDAVFRPEALSSASAVASANALAAHVSLSDPTTVDPSRPQRPGTKPRPISETLAEPTHEDAVCAADVARRALVEALDMRERALILLTMGFEGAPRTLTEAAEELRISLPLAKKISASAMRKLAAWGDMERLLEAEEATVR